MSLRGSRKGIVAAAGVLLAIACAALLFVCRAQVMSALGLAWRPFSDLEASQLEGVYLEFGAFDPYRLEDEDAEAAVAALREVAVDPWSGGEEYRDYTGTDFCTLVLSYPGGSVTRISCANPFFIVDGVGYRAVDHNQLEALTDVYHPLIPAAKAASEYVPTK